MCDDQSRDLSKDNTRYLIRGRDEGYSPAATANTWNDEGSRDHHQSIDITKSVRLNDTGLRVGRDVDHDRVYPDRGGTGARSPTLLFSLAVD